MKLQSFTILHGQHRTNKKNERVIDRKSPKPIRYLQKTSHMKYDKSFELLKNVSHRHISRDINK